MSPRQGVFAAGVGDQHYTQSFPNRGRGFGRRRENGSQLAGQSAGQAEDAWSATTPNPVSSVVCAASSQ